MGYRNYKYDGSIDRYPIVEGEVYELPNGSKLSINDLNNGVPSYMKEAQVIFIDPPCSKVNLKSFYTKANLDNVPDVIVFYQNIIKAIQTINPSLLVMELFASNKDYFIEWAKQNYPFVKVEESTYYHNKKNRCWLMQAGLVDCNLSFEGIDEWDAVYKLAKDMPFDCIGDFCIGQGLVAIAAQAAGKKFVGCELNRNRISVAIAKVAKNGGEWKVRKL